MGIIKSVGRQAIVEAIEENATVVILGETGSGKTTRTFRNPARSRRTGVAHTPIFHVS